MQVHVGGHQSIHSPIRAKVWIWNMVFVQKGEKALELQMCKHDIMHNIYYGMCKFYMFHALKYTYTSPETLPILSQLPCTALDPLDLQKSLWYKTYQDEVKAW